MRLKELRLLNGLTQQKVADHIGCTPPVYSRYESGEREPSIETLIKLAHYFGVTVDCLIGNEASPIEGLNSFEISLVCAARCADERAREDALNMLRAHPDPTKKEQLA